jgi:hypothetical protein
MSTAALPMASNTGQNDRRNDRSALASALLPLALDVALPLAAYYAARQAFGLPMVPALIVSSVVPAVRTVLGLVRGREWNLLAVLILASNVVGVATTFLTGDARLMIAKDGLVSSVIGASVLLSVVRGRPMMSTALRPFLTRGNPAREAAWEALRSGGGAAAAFRRAEQGYSLVWGIALLAECVARVVGAYTLPLTIMVWLPTALLVGAIVLASLVSRPLATRMHRAIDAAA